MKKILPVLILIGCLAVGLAMALPMISVEADELEKTTQALNTKKAELDKAQEALEAARQRESALSSGVSGLQASLDVAVAEATVKQAEADAALADFERQEVLLKAKQEYYATGMKSLYKLMMTHKATQMATLLDAGSLVEYTRIADYQSKILQDERERVIVLAEEVLGLEDKKTELKAVADKAQSEKAVLEQRMASLKSQIAGARGVQQSNSNAIASLTRDIQGLSSKQAQLVAEKLAANDTRSTVGDHATISTPLPNPGFSPAFAFASYGYPHRIGMSQYGARGRASAGQSYSQILKAYYKNIQVGSYATPSTVTVNGYSPEYNQTFNNVVWPFEEYLKHLYEMPASWPMEALKAQAVAARSYTLNWLQSHGNGAICPSQSCQVVKHEINSSRWQEAVEATKGIVATHNGAPIAAWYSSTVGGYTQSSAQVWGGVTGYTQVVKDYVGSWPAGGYDKDSPWYHKSWGDRSGSGGCNKNTGSGCNPWLTKAQTVDLLNAALLYQQTGQASAGDYDLSGPGSGGTSAEGVVAALQSRNIQPIGDFSLITFSHNDGTGQTDTVNVIGGPRSHTMITGANFRKIYNLRSPGTLGIMSSLFDAVTK